MGFWHSVQKLWQPFTSRRTSHFSAAISFYLILSLPSLLTLFLWFAARFPSLTGVLLLFLEAIVPDPLLSLLLDTLQVTSATVPLLSVSAILWSSAKGLHALTDGLNAAVALPDHTRFLKRRLRACVHLLVLILCLLAILAVIIFSEQVLYAPVFSRLFHTESVPWLRISASVFLSVSFAVFYALLPQTQIPLRWCICSGSASAAFWLVVSRVFSYYISHFSNLDQIYGTAGLMVLSMLWLHLCVNGLLCGAILADLLANSRYHPWQYVKEAWKFLKH